jgi:aquacobalamin reductase/NAD(P)H-flavin reductase
MKSVNCKITSITEHHAHLYKVKLDAQALPDYKPGQYLWLHMGEDDRRPFSIASAPHESSLELHIGAGSPDSFAMQVIDKLKTSESITVDVAEGNAYLRQDIGQQRLIVVGGTGFSYAKSLLLGMCHNQEQIPTTLYWGCSQPEHLYDLSVCQDLAEEHDWLTFIPVLEHNADTCQARSGMLLDVVCDDLKDLSSYAIYVAGRFEMARVAKERFLQHHAVETMIFGDAFSFG